MSWYIFAKFPTQHLSRVRVCSAIGTCNSATTNLESSEIYHHLSWQSPDVKNRPSGKNQHNYGKSPCSMGKSTINGHFQ